jgi:hypothetical protein
VFRIVLSQCWNSVGKVRPILVGGIFLKGGNFLWRREFANVAGLFCHLCSKNLLKTALSLLISIPFPHYCLIRMICMYAFLFHAHSFSLIIYYALWPPCTAVFAYRLIWRFFRGPPPSPCFLRGPAASSGRAGCQSISPYMVIISTPRGIAVPVRLIFRLLRSIAPLSGFACRVWLAKFKILSFYFPY